jgi:hypothetical protein
MAKTIVIKLTSSGPTAGPFTITDEFGNILATGVTKDQLIEGVSYSVADNVTMVTLESTGKCKSKKTFPVGVTNPVDLASAEYTQVRTACLWRHLKNPVIYNYFYGNIEQYIIEYPFAYQYQDEILQSVQDYTKAYKYFPDPDGVSDDNRKIETDDAWFNKAVVYNGQQSSGVLELVPKPINNLKEYLKYPIYNTDSKTITFTKSDNFYQYNTFWSLVKYKQEPLFVRTCEGLSIDKLVNQANMDYGKRSFKKEPLRAKELKVRHILDNRYDAHLVSQFIITPAQISYK